MSRNRMLSIVISFMLLIIQCGGSRKAELILKNGRIYTMEEEQPWAEAVVIRGNRILAVLNNEEDIDPFIDASTRIIDLNGAFTVPGFIDAHTHFDEFSERICDVDLMPVSGDQGLITELKRVMAFVEEGEWITGGKWDGHRLWNEDWRKRELLKKNRWKPNCSTIDPFTPHNPCLLWSWDKELYLANTAALKLAKLDNAGLKGMDLHNGKPTGLVVRTQ